MNRKLCKPDLHLNFATFHMTYTEIFISSLPTQASQRCNCCFGHLRAGLPTDGPENLCVGFQVRPRHTLHCASCV